MQYEILGVMVVRGETGEVAINGAKRRALLTRLLIDANRTVSTGQLIADLWGEDPPDGAGQTLQSHISQLRRLLGADAIVTDPVGYRLVADNRDIDARAFEDDVSGGDRERALQRWRGPALAEVADEHWARPAAVHLEELRLTATEALADEKLAQGDTQTALAIAERALNESPLRERLWAQVMLGLYRSGRQADALAAYQRARVVLTEELGLEPGVELKQLEAAILRQDPSLDVTPAKEAATLPSGVVTFLMSDVVGSTRLWETHPHEMADALTRHDQLMQRAISTHAGLLIKARGEGDSTFSVFRRATDAALGALDAQATLTAEVWPEDCAIAVRMALHTGEALEVDGDYRGGAVNRVARLRAVAEPGQILVSHATADVIIDHLPPSASLTELGTQELRDLTRPETVYLLASRDDAPAATTPPQSWASLPAALRQVATPFAGRAEESRLLADALADATHGVGRVVLVSGDPGIGKTRLCAEFAASALAAGAVVAYGRSDREVGLPYQPFIQALSALVEAAPQHLLNGYAKSFGGELARLTPALTRRVRPLPAPRPTTPDTERHLLFDSVRGLIQHLGPTVLVIDDLHWADRPTLQLARYLADEASALALVLVVAFRTGELDPDAPFVDLLDRLGRDGADHLQLGGLPAIDLTGLIRALADTDNSVAEELARRVGAETGGNPLFTVELVRHLAERSFPTEFAMPESIREVVSRRVSRLGDGPSSVLTLASVVGLEFDLALLAQAIERDEDDVLAALELAAEAHLVNEAGTPGRFAFSHALIAHTLEQSLSSTRRARWHLRVARAIEDIRGGGGGPHLPELAGHLVAAGPLADVARVRALAYAAGNQALRQLAPDEAVRWYDEALSRSSDEAERSDLLIALGTAQRQAGNPSFRETLLYAAHLAMGRGDDERLLAAAVANTRGSRARTFFIDRERVEVLEAATAGRVESPQMARALALLAAETTHDDDWSLRLARSNASLEMARRLEDPATLAEVLRLRFETIHFPDTLATRLKEADELMALGETLGDPLPLAYAYLWRAIGLLESGALDESDGCAERAAELAGKVRDPFLLWNLATRRCVRALIAGELDEAERLAFASYAVAEETGEPDGRNVLGDHLLVIRDAQGRLAEMEQAMRRTVERYPHVRGMRAVLAYLCSELGNDAEAIALLDEDAADGMSRYTRDLVWLSFLSYAGRAATNVRHKLAAERLLPSLSPWRDQVVWSGSSAHEPVALVLGGLALTLGRDDEALVYAREANDLSRRMRAPLWISRCLLLEARARPASDRGSALGEALDLARRHGFASVEQQVTVLQQAAG